MNDGMRRNASLVVQATTNAEFYKISNFIEDVHSLNICSQIYFKSWPNKTILSAYVGSAYLELRAVRFLGIFSHQFSHKPQNSK